MWYIIIFLSQSIIGKELSNKKEEKVKASCYLFSDVWKKFCVA